ncbi:MAG: cobalt-precorrin-6A reductase [Thermosynechococcaceae cyanobacterium]
MQCINRGPQRVLVLGGTSEATELVAKMAEIPQVEVILSLAGRTQNPRLSGDQTRIGGFDGAGGLTDYLRAQHIDWLIDATHAFAAQMSFHAATAATAANIPRLMLLRPAWKPVAGDRWIEVDSLAAAADRLPQLAQRIFLTVGRQELAVFAPLQTLWFLMRMIDAPLPDASVPPGLVLLRRGPFTWADERSLLEHHAIGAVVSKNSGGEATYAKIRAARALKLPIVMVQRPPMPAGERVETVSQALGWLVDQL